MSKDPSADYTVQIVTDPAEADARVQVVGGAAVDLSGASPGDVLVVQADGSLAAEAPSGGGSGAPAPSDLYVGNTDFGAVSAMDDIVAFDTQVSVVGSDLSWSISDPTKIHVVTAGVYHFFAAAVPVNDYPPVGSRRVSILVPGLEPLAQGNPVYPSEVTAAPISHSVTGRVAAGSDVTCLFRQASGVNWAGELFVVRASRIA